MPESRPRGPGADCRKAPIETAMRTIRSVAHIWEWPGISLARAGACHGFRIAVQDAIPAVLRDQTARVTCQRARPRYIPACWASRRTLTPAVATLPRRAFLRGDVPTLRGDVPTRLQNGRDRQRATARDRFPVHRPESGPVGRMVWRSAMALWRPGAFRKGTPSSGWNIGAFCKKTGPPPLAQNQVSRISHPRMITAARSGRALCKVPTIRRLLSHAQGPSGAITSMRDMA